MVTLDFVPNSQNLLLIWLDSKSFVSTNTAHCQGANVNFTDSQLEKYC